MGKSKKRLKNQSKVRLIRIKLVFLQKETRKTNDGTGRERYFIWEIILLSYA